MNRYFIFISVVLFVFLSCSFVSSMTREQIKRSGKMIRRSCSAKNNITEDDVKDIDKGKFIEEKEFMCYIACIYKMGQSINGNKMNYNMMLRQVDMVFPSEIKASAKAAIEHCKGVSKTYKDICEVAYWTAKCVYDKDPESFLFP